MLIITISSNAEDKVRDSLKQLLANSEGTHGKEKVLFKDILSEAELEKYADDLKNLVNKEFEKGTSLKKEVEKIAQEIANKTHVYENITVKGGKEVKASTVRTLLQDSIKFFKEYGKTVDIPIEEYAKKSKRLVNSKSALGMLPAPSAPRTISSWREACSWCCCPW